MNHESGKKTSLDYRVVIYLILGLVGLIIISDFLIPGKVFNQEIVDIDSNLQQYYNAGGRSHMSYDVVTTDHAFTVSEEFADSVKLGMYVEYSVSRVFSEVNWYQFKAQRSEIHSLRLFSGLLIPLIVLAAMGYTYFTKRNLETLIFVFQVLLVADLVFLIM
jgi:small-conductance mechanosensitive channel